MNGSVCFTTCLHYLALSAYITIRNKHMFPFQDGTKFQLILSYLHDMTWLKHVQYRRDGTFIPAYNDQDAARRLLLSKVKPDNMQVLFTSSIVFDIHQCLSPHMCNTQQSSDLHWVGCIRQCLSPSRSLSFSPTTQLHDCFKTNTYKFQRWYFREKL